MDEIDKGYYKVHLTNDFVTMTMQEILPVGLSFKKAAQLAIAFYSSRPTKSPFHVDMDIACLIVLNGRKMVRFWPDYRPRTTSEGYSTIDEDVDLFDDDCDENQVVTVELVRGEALLIPAGYWHQVWSSANTIGLSIQVTCKSLPKWDRSHVAKTETSSETPRIPLRKRKRST